MRSAVAALYTSTPAINSGGIGHDFHFSLAWILWHVGLVGSVLVVLSAILAACGAAMFGAVAESIGGIEITVAEVSRSEQSSQGTREQRRVAA